MVLFIITLFLIATQQYCTGKVAVSIDDVSEDLDLIRTQHYLPGLSGAVWKNGQAVAQGASGYRRQGYTTPLLITDRINIGSCSKWMTATLAGRLIDRKFLNWTTQVHECFPNYTSFNKAFHNATLEQFLAHRSGVQQSTTFYSRHWAEFMAQKGSYREIRYWTAETVLKDAPEVAPGEYLYANQGYAVAAAMMEQRTGRDWESLIQDYIFNPLEMTDTTVAILYNGTIPPETPAGHTLSENSTVPVLFPTLSPLLLHNDQGATGPAGYIACTIQDWVKFLHAHVSPATTGFLTTETAAKLKRPYIDVEGYGLGVMAYNRTWATPGQALTHNGDIAGQDTVFWMSPGRDIIIVAYTNCRSADSATDIALNAAAELLLRRLIHEE